MRIYAAFFLACAVLLSVPQESIAHGTERHYGNSLDERPVVRASPALSIIVIEASLSAIRRTLNGRAEQDIDERLDTIAMVTASLLYTTTGNQHTPSEFAGFAEVLQKESDDLRRAAKDARPDQALQAFETLENSFSASKSLFKSREKEQ